MFKKRGTAAAIILVAGCLAVVVGFSRSQAQPYTTPTVTRIAVVDVAKALSECQENKAREKYSEDLSLKIRSELEQLSREADEIRQELENALDPDSEAYKAGLRDFFDKSALRESYEKYQEQVLTTEAQVWIESLYQKFLDEVGRVAQQDGIGLVFGKDATPIQARSRADVAALIRTRKILYNSQFLDITAKVMTNMDRAYEQAQVKKATTVK